MLALTAVAFAVVADHGILAHIQRVDDAWLRLMVSGRSAPVTVIAKFFNLLGLVYVTLPVRIAIAGYLALRRRWWHMAAFVAAVVLSEVLIGTLKNAYDRTRPPGSLVATSGASFPSGHAIAASVTVVAAVIALVPAGPAPGGVGRGRGGLLGPDGGLASLPRRPLAVRCHRRDPARDVLRAAGRGGGRRAPAALAGAPGGRGHGSGPRARAGHGPAGRPAMSGHPVAVAMETPAAVLPVPAPGRRDPADRREHPAAGIAGGLEGRAPLAARRGRARGGGIGSGAASSVLTGIVQVACVAAAALVVAATLWHRRFRLLLGLAAGAAVAAGVAAGIVLLLGGRHPAALTDNLAHGSWLASAAFPGPALIAGAVAVIVAASPWLSRPWRRAAWLTLLLVVVVRLVTGTVLPMELLLAFATGLTVGAAVLVVFGVPDRRMGAGEIAEALRSAGLPAESVRPADVASKGSRPFAAAGADGQRWFIKALGSDQRDADLLYRAYRAVRLRNVGDTRPARRCSRRSSIRPWSASWPNGPGSSCPASERVIKAGDDTALLVMDWVDGSPLEQLPAGQITDDLLVRLWADVDKLHKAGIAHRSLRAANVMVGQDGQPVIVDFSFSELSATRRQMDLDVAELLASLAALVGEDRAVSAAVKVLGAEGVAPAVPLLQPLALSAGTRRAVARQDGLLTRTRSAAAAASGLATPELVRVQRVRPRTLLTIAALAGAYYILLPQLAKVGNPWPALESAQWAWVLVAIAFSALTYLASAIGLLGGVSVRVPFWPTVLTQGASSFVNRVSPSNVGGMALNVRFLQKAGVEPSAGVAAVGVNSLAGALVHGVLLVIFFAWAGRGGAGKAFKLPSSSTLLAVLAVAAAVIGIVIATRQGRRFAARKLLPPLRSSLASLRKVARSPVRLTLLFGGSALVTLAYVGGLVASVEAFGGGASIAKIGAVYMASAVVAAFTPTPGGVGGFEAAAIAGLTGIGISSGAAVSAVVIYRLATYWLPVLPGWLSWRLLQRLDYV